jgi:hypothetical protein
VPAVLAYAVIPLVDTLTLKWFMRAVEIRAGLVGRMVEGPVVDLLADKSKTKFVRDWSHLCGWLDSLRRSGARDHSHIPAVSGLFLVIFGLIVYDDSLTLLTSFFERHGIGSYIDD